MQTEQDVPDRPVLSNDKLIQTFHNFSDVQRFVEDERIRVTKKYVGIPDFCFIHSGKATEDLHSASPILLGGCEYIRLDEVIRVPIVWLIDPPPPGTHGDIVSTTTELKNWILSKPGIKGALVDFKSAAVSIFRPVPPRVSCDDLFWKRFSRSKVNNDFKDDLFNELLDIYICTMMIQI
jgi:hypothetical protein